MPPVMKKGRHENWADLQPELMSSILLRIGVIEILENAQRVCRSWRHVCKDHSVWITTSRSCVVTQLIAAKAACLRLTFGTDDLLNYIAVR
ncbi:hypothetical protein N665_0741s0016 [Sinapis alba]|nr:hypothetical protein N665_0741s0016 [Sinapis alba]